MSYYGFIDYKLPTEGSNVGIIRFLTISVIINKELKEPISRTQRLRNTRTLPWQTNKKQPYQHYDKKRYLKPYTINRRSSCKSY